MNENIETLDNAFPVTVRISDRLCVFIGHRAPVVEKALALSDAGARIRIVSDKLPQQLHGFDEPDRIEIIQRPYQPDDVEGAFMVFAGADEPALNADIVDECRHRGIICARIDVAWDLGDFFIPSSLEYQDVLISISGKPGDVAQVQHVRRMFQDFLFSTEPMSQVKEIDPRKGIIIVTHHIDHDDANNHFLDQVDYLRFQMIEAAIEPAFIGGDETTLADAVNSLLDRNVKEISVLPFFLCKGRRWFEGIPKEIHAALDARGVNDVPLTVLDPIGVHPLVNELLLSIASGELA